jgi:integrase
MYNYNTLKDEFLQYKHFLGVKYNTELIIMNDIVNYLIENKIEIITNEVTKNYIRRNPNISSNTIARNMGVFREFCLFLKLQKGIECYQIPLKIYPQNHHNFTPYIFSNDEIKMIYKNLNFINNYHYSYYSQISYPLIIKILYQTGMRIGEVCNLTLKNYNGNLGIFTLLNTKNGHDRNVAIPDTLNIEINNFIHKFYLGKNDDTKIFKISADTINKYFKKVLRLANINITDKGPRLHDLRHTYIVHNINQAIDRMDNLDVFLPILQAQVGHQSLSSLSYYFHITNDLLNIVNKISEDELGYLIRTGESHE